MSNMPKMSSNSNDLSLSSYASVDPRKGPTPAEQYTYMGKLEQKEKNQKKDPQVGQVANILTSSVLSAEDALRSQLTAPLRGVSSVLLDVAPVSNQGDDELQPPTGGDVAKLLEPSPAQLSGSSVKNGKPRRPPPPDVSTLSGKAYRLYRSFVTFEADVTAVKRYDSVPLYYRIGTRGNMRAIMTPNSAKTDRAAMQQTIQMNAELALDFASQARRFSGFVTDHSKMDLGGLIEQLAAGMAAYATYGVLKFSDLANHKDVNIIPIASLNPEYGPTMQAVFIPRYSDSPFRPALFAAVVAASAACGSAIVSDLVGVNTASGKVVYTEYHDGALAMGCYEALCLIATHYSLSDAGNVFAYAMMRGIHRVVSVVGHTDEGGVIRGLLRTGAYDTPYGGISVATRIIPTIPRPIDDSFVSFRKLVDSYALASAGLVALCDPGIMVNEKRIPTVFAFSGTDEYKMYTYGYNTRRFVECLPGFFNRYAPALGRLVMLSGGTDTVTNFALFCASHPIFINDRHFKGQTMAPFFWVEPTGVVPTGYYDLEADAVVKPYAYVDTPVSHRLFPPAASVVDIATLDYTLATPYTSLRDSALFAWLAGRTGDGLALISITACDTTQLTNTGPDTPPGYCSGVHSDTPVNLNQLRWRYGDNPFPKPHEVLYTGKGVHLEFKCFDPLFYGDNPLNRRYAEVTVLPSVDKVLSATIKVSVTPLQAVEWAEIGTVPCERQRVRNAAIMNLGLADMLRTRGVFSAGKKVFKMGDVDIAAPSPPQPPPRTSVDDDVDVGFGGGRVTQKGVTGQTATAKNRADPPVYAEPGKFTKPPGINPVATPRAPVDDPQPSQPSGDNPPDAAV